ncbi:Uu.00g032400.m01.CDS01 [Anthostomella pinea]|uniref:Uu.00g032400.m01.CDS01 n=1 Tax=Anthostomella pinea TaxID=933095 RepID=A0AAI8YD63_9PEZI|nr:Uu.00g032400.m01.CDS01 [Anthostomella pinea]
MANYIVRHHDDEHRQGADYIEMNEITFLYSIQNDQGPGNESYENQSADNDIARNEPVDYDESMENANVFIGYDEAPGALRRMATYACMGSTGQASTYDHDGCLPGEDMPPTHTKTPYGLTQKVGFAIHSAEEMLVDLVARLPLWRASISARSSSAT